MYNARRTCESYRVTPQAISRWEAGGGYPDIELLPEIADFFSVTIDELLGYRRSEREERRAHLNAEMARLTEVGTLQERLAFARMALSEFPSDYKIKENLAVCLYHLWRETGDETILPEVVSLCRSVFEDCKEADIRYDALFTLVQIYSQTNQSEKAKEIAEHLVPMKYCREFCYSSGLGDGKTEVYIQQEIDKLTDCLGTAIQNLVLNDDVTNAPSTWDKKIRMLTISNKLYYLIYGENLQFYHCRVAFNHWIISTYQISLGKKDDALLSLEKMCEHTVAYDFSYEKDHGKPYSSVLTDKLVYPEPQQDSYELKEHSYCFYMLDRLHHPRYDCLRKQERFVKIQEILKKHSR